MIFTEKESRFSKYLKFEDEGLTSVSFTDPVPKLSLLRVEMERVHPGMSDFVMRVATPRYTGVQKSGNILSIRGNRTFTKFDTVVTLAETICAKMEERDDPTHQWPDADAEHLAQMLYGAVKYFAANTRIEKLRFSTEALA